DHRDVGRRAPGRLHDKAGGHEVEARTADVLVQVDPEEARIGALLPQPAGEGPFVARLGLELLEALVRDAVGEDPAGQLADGLLLLAVGEVHGVSVSWFERSRLSAATAACRGRRW